MVERREKRQGIVNLLLLIPACVLGIATGVMALRGEPFRAASEIAYGADAPLMDAALVDTLISPVSGLVLLLLVLVSVVKEFLVPAYSRRVFLSAAALVLFIATGALMTRVMLLPALGSP